MRSRTLTALAGIAGSLALSLVLWWVFDTLLFFLFVPIVPFLFRRSTREPSPEEDAVCPRCGFETTDASYEFCPRDGSRLE